MKATWIIAALCAVTLALPAAGAFAQQDGALKHALDAPYPAPEIARIDHWINTEGPLAMADLKGKVVLVDFWTYSCINCIRTFPYINRWYEKYRDQGFEIVGVHTPEFNFEYKAPKVEAAVKKFGIRYPVALDNKKQTWNNFKNRYWPAHYLINRDGQVVYTHFGEGQYDVTEHNIRVLLGMAPSGDLEKGEKVTSRKQTPETYLGNLRMKTEWKGDAPLPLHHWRLSGNWLRGKENIRSTAKGDALTLHFAGRKVFLVLSTHTGEPVDVEIALDVEGNAAGDVEKGMLTVAESRLYEIVKLPRFSRGTVTIRALGPGLEAYAFTFES